MLVAVVDVLVDHSLFLGRSAADSEDHLFLHRGEDFFVSDEQKGSLVDELAADLWQEPACSYEELVVSLFVLDSSVFHEYILILASFDLDL